MNEREYDIIRRVWPEYRIIGRIGAGDHSRVYLVSEGEGAEETRFAVKVVRFPLSEDERNAAKKVLKLSSEEETREYYRGVLNTIVEDLEKIEQLRYSGSVVGVLGTGTLELRDPDGWAVLIRMEHLDNLEDYVNRVELSEADIIRLGIHMCRALDSFHNRGIIIRDLKESDIFLTELGGFKLGNFGISGHLDFEPADFSHLKVGKAFAPEVMRGSKVRANADVYSLGLVLYRLLNNHRNPFLPARGAVSDSMVNDAEYKRAFGVPVLPPERGSDALIRVIQRACDNDPRIRYQTALEMEQDLTGCLIGERPEDVTLEEMIEVGGLEKVEASPEAEENPEAGEEPQAGEKPQASESDAVDASAESGQEAETAGKETAAEETDAEKAETPDASGETSDGAETSDEKPEDEKAAVAAASVEPAEEKTSAKEAPEKPEKPADTDIEAAESAAPESESEAGAEPAAEDSKADAADAFTSGAPSDESEKPEAAKAPVDEAKASEDAGESEKTEASEEASQPSKPSESSESEENKEENEKAAPAAEGAPDENSASENMSGAESEHDAERDGKDAARAKEESKKRWMVIGTIAVAALLVFLWMTRPSNEPGKRTAESSSSETASVSSSESEKASDAQASVQPEKEKTPVAEKKPVFGFGEMPAVNGLKVVREGSDAKIDTKSWTNTEKDGTIRGICLVSNPSGDPVQFTTELRFKDAAGKQTSQPIRRTYVINPGCTGFVRVSYDAKSSEQSLVLLFKDKVTGRDLRSDASTELAVHETAAELTIKNNSDAAGLGDVLVLGVTGDKVVQSAYFRFDGSLDPKESEAFGLKDWTPEKTLVFLNLHE